MNLIKSTTTFSFYTLISRILGYFRDVLIAIYLGSGPMADAFFVAFRIPNTFRRLFSEGTFNAAFVPSYSSELIKGEEKGKKFANDVFNLLLFSLLIIVLVIEVFMPGFVYIIAPGFEQNSEKINLTVNLTRLTFPFLLFVSLASFFSAILNSHNKFAAAAAAPIILNILLIFTLFFATYLNDDLVFYLSYAVTIAGFLQLSFLLFYVKKIYFPKFDLSFKINNKVKIFFKKLLPSIFSSGVTQINILVGTIIASFEAGAVSYLYYADRIYQINLAIAGIAVGTVSLPILSKSLKIGKAEETNSIQNKSIELCFLFSIPASLGLIIASREIVDALFGYGSFSKEDVITTANALKYFGYGVPAFALVKILSNFFFARHNTKTPFYLSLFSVVLNISISVIYFKEVGFIIIPIATSVSTWITVFLYLILLSKSNFLFLKSLPLFNFFKIAISTAIMSFALYYGIGFFEDKLIYSNNYKSIYLLVMIGLVATIYLIFCYLFGLLKIKNYKTN